MSPSGKRRDMFRYASVVKLSVIAAIAAITLTACAAPTPTATPRPTPTPTSENSALKASEVARHSLGPVDAPVTVVDVSDFQ
jgi:hypothetical protein